MNLSDFSKRLAQLCTGSPLVNFPTRSNSRHILLKSIAIEFESGVEYSEKEVNDVILHWLEVVGRRVVIDHVNLRRGLVDERYLKRKRDGGTYFLDIADPAEVGFPETLSPADVGTHLDAEWAKREERRQASSTSADQSHDE